MAGRKKVRVTSDDLAQDIESIASENLGDLEENESAIKYWLPTGCLMLDLAINNGLPGGKIIELFGTPGSGKTLLALSIVKSAQAHGGMGIWLDAEAGISHSLMDLVGVRRDEGWVYRLTQSTEKTLDTIESMVLRSVDSETPVVIVLDSVAGLCPESLLMGQEPMTGARVTGKMGSIMSWFFSRGVPRTMMGSNVYLIFINQIRSTYNFYDRFNRGPQFTTPGGHSINFYAHVRLECERLKIEEDEFKRPLQSLHRVTVDKNKVGMPNRSVTFPFIFRRNSPIVGIDDISTTLNYMIAKKVLRPSTPGSSWYELDGTDLKFQAKGWKEKLIEDKELFNKLKVMAVRAFQEEYGYLTASSVPAKK